MAPKIDSSFPTELFQNSWNFTPFDQTPDFHFPATNPALLELISPAEFTNPCPFGEFQPFLDALTSPEFGSFYDKDDHLPPMSIQEDYAAAGESLFLDGFKVENSAHGSDTINIDVYSNVGMYSEKRSKSKKPEGQPSKNLMAERRRRKRLNDRLSMLRSIVPKISKMDRTSILGDTIDYMRELLDKIHKLREEEEEEAEEEGAAIRSYFKELKPNETQLRNPPKFDVERRNEDTRIELCCTAKPGLLLSTLTTLDALGLDLQQCVISCFNDFSLQASCFESAEQRSMVSSEDVKQALFRNAGYGGRCL
ncbi:beta HLH protein 93 [Perilla frutescens var. hirtella]|uniref:Beta HLH protein 93 n=1 Tax=Perilla frutescens var. hirtella TaxID=608512 RepID=A0AAD4J302_PERFH|nr:beta HLH protein 93 [Perilla frutescens var. hirtella]